MLRRMTYTSMAALFYRRATAFGPAYALNYCDPVARATVRVPMLTNPRSHAPARVYLAAGKPALRGRVRGAVRGRDSVRASELRRPASGRARRHAESGSNQLQRSHRIDRDPRRAVGGLLRRLLPRALRAA